MARLGGGFAWLPLLPFFSRVEKDAALDSPRRSQVYHAIEQRPGIRFYELKRSLGIPHGVLVHHLRVLRGSGLVMFEREGRRLRFRLPGQRVPPEVEPEARRILQAVNASPGILLSELSAQLGWTRRKAGYWVSRLEQDDLLERIAGGWHARMPPFRVERILRRSAPS